MKKIALLFASLLSLAALPAQAATYTYNYQAPFNETFIVSGNFTSAQQTMIIEVEAEAGNVPPGWEGVVTFATTTSNGSNSYDAWDFAYCNTVKPCYYPNPRIEIPISALNRVWNLTAGLFGGVCEPHIPFPNCLTAQQATTSAAIHVTLPDNLYLTPLPAALPLFAFALGSAGLLGWRRSRKAGGTET